MHTQPLPLLEKRFHEMPTELLPRGQNLELLKCILGPRAAGPPPREAGGVGRAAADPPAQRAAPPRSGGLVRRSRTPGWGRHAAYPLPRSGRGCAAQRRTSPRSGLPSREADGKPRPAQPDVTPGEGDAPPLDVASVAPHVPLSTYLQSSYAPTTLVQSSSTEASFPTLPCRCWTPPCLRRTVSSSGPCHSVPFLGPYPWILLGALHFQSHFRWASDRQPAPNQETGVSTGRGRYISGVCGGKMLNTARHDKHVIFRWQMGARDSNSQAAVPLGDQRHILQTCSVQHPLCSCRLAGTNS